MSRNPVVRIVLLIALVGILAGDVTLVLVRRGAVAGGVEKADPLPDDSPLARALPRLEAFVERTRGLRFKRRVPVQLLADDAFTERLRDIEPHDQQEVDEDIEAFEAFLRVLGLSDGDLDLAAVDAAIEDNGVLGFYDPEEAALYVRGDSLGPFEELILVHELTHALEDQHFGLDRPDLDERNDEASESFLALVEGSAVVVEQRFLESLPSDRRRVAEAGEEAAGEANGEVPDVIDALFGYPYRDGPVFVSGILAEGGPARLDAALVDPPTTSEQVLHPARFLAGEGPRPVGRPRADGSVDDSGVLGERVLELVLARAAGPATGRRAAEGWGGDRYVVWSSGGRTCIRWNLVMDTPADTAELVTALRAFTSRNRSARVESTDPVVVLTNCA